MHLNYVYKTIPLLSYLFMSQNKKKILNFPQMHKKVWSKDFPMFSPLTFLLKTCKKRNEYIYNNNYYNSDT